MNRLGIRHTYDKLWIGILFGALIPFVMYAILLSISDALTASEMSSENGLVYGFRPRTLALIALLANIIPMQIFYRKHWDDAMRGMVFPTLIYAGIWFYLYGLELLGIS
ncbi:MAG: hypothetical protein IPM48_10500 [Saprospiraceae bacterium]|nr:hypothetical protein [Saprospiraceae bacterium]